MKDSNVAQLDAGGSGLFHMDLAQAKSRIKQAWIFAVFSGVVSAIFSVLALSGVEGLEIFRFAMIDALILFALAYGVHRKSRAAASILVVYWVFNIITLGLSSAVVVRLVFLTIFILGAWATFVYDRLQGEQNTDPVSSIRDQILS